MTNDVHHEIRRELAKVGLGKVHGDVLSKCIGLSTTLQLTPQKMAECWETFSLNQGAKTLDDASFPSFRLALIKLSEVAVAKRATPDAPPVPSVTPNKKLRPTISDKSHLPQYNARKNVGAVVASFNPQLDPIEANDKPCSIDVASFATNVPESYRTHFTTLDERARVLEDQLEQAMDLFAEKLDDSIPWEAVGVPRQEKIRCVGRICNSAHEGKLNATSILLEGSRTSAGGARIEVDLSYLQEHKIPYSLFSGQIVAIEGLNTSGRKLVAHQIHEGLAAPMISTTVADNLKMMTVCGPYTTSDNLDYEPLVDLINVVHREKPDAVILMGPFVDMNHEALQSGGATLQFEGGDEILVSYETFFANKISALLEDLYAADPDLTTQFVLVPSLRDATSEWVYPQAPLSDRLSHPRTSSIPGSEGIEIGTLGLRNVGANRVHCVSNPCTLLINNVSVAVTSEDVICHIAADETNGNLEAGSRMTHLAQHMVQQRSFYPIFPAHTGMNVDLKKMPQYSMPCQPDLLVVPSKLRSFASERAKTVILNPGQLTKGTTGGTYAMVEVREASGDEDRDLTKRTRIEVKNI